MAGPGPESSSMHHQDKRSTSQRRGSSTSTNSSSRSRILQSPGLQISNPSASMRQPQQAQSRPRKDQTKRPQHQRSTQREERSVVFSTELQDPSLTMESLQLTATPSPNKRGQVSLNHLLNFTFPARQQAPAPARRRQDKEYVPYNKEKYINANFRFVLYPDRDYRGAMVEPDVTVPWEDISQVLATTEKETSCPICLSPPVAPRMTHCGHIYCWPCLEHYIALGERAWRKCPICYDSVYLRDIKPVRFFEAKPLTKPSPDHPQCLRFTLMKRDTGSTIALPVNADILIHDESGQSKRQAFPSASVYDAAMYSRYCIGNLEYMKQSVWDTDLEALEAYKANILSEKEAYGAHASVDADLPFVETSILKIKESLMLDELPSVPTIRKLLRSKNLDISPTTPQDDTLAYYFYQASDGRPIFLHPLDIKILKREFSDYASFPATLTCRIISVQESTVNQALRKKCKYLAHLPLSCDLSICELDLSDIVSSETLFLFENELEARKNRLERLVRQAETSGPNSTSLKSFLQSTSEYVRDTGYDHLHAEDYTEAFPVPDASMSSPNTKSAASSFQVSFAQIATKTKTKDARTLGIVLPSADDFPSLGSSLKSPQKSNNTSPSRIRNHVRGRSYDLSDDPFDDEEDHGDYEDDSFQGWTLDYEEAVLTSDAGWNGYSGVGLARKQMTCKKKGRKSDNVSVAKDVTNAGSMAPFAPSDLGQVSHPETTPDVKQDGLSASVEQSDPSVSGGKKKNRKPKKQLLVSNTGHRFR